MNPKWSIDTFFQEGVGYEHMFHLSLLGTLKLPHTHTPKGNQNHVYQNLCNAFQNRDPADRPRADHAGRILRIPLDPTHDPA